jgi:hypothetical protein
VKWKDWQRRPGHAGHDAEEGLEKEAEDFIGNGNQHKGLLIVPCLPRYVTNSSSSAKSSLTLSLRQRARLQRLGTVREQPVASSLAVVDRSREFKNSWLVRKRPNCQVQLLRL